MRTLPAKTRTMHLQTLCRLLITLFIAGNAFALPGGDPAVDIESIPQETTAPENLPAVVPVPERMEDMSAYLASLRTHVESNPGLAAAYLVFWSELTANAAALKADESGKRYAALADIALQVSRNVGLPQSAGRDAYLVTDILQSTLRTLAGKPNFAAGKTENMAPLDVAERLLGNLQPEIVPYVNEQGRYQLPGALPTIAAIGSGAEVWNLCRTTPACVETHDRLFAPAMSGQSLLADVQKRLLGDQALSKSLLWQSMQPIAQSLDADLAKQATPEQRSATLLRASNEQWKVAMADLPAATGLNIPLKPAESAPSDSTLDALFTLGQASAQLAGSDRLARAFATTRSPALEFASLASQSALAGSFATSVAGVALLVAGVQALSFLDDDAADAQASNELRQLITALDARTYAAIGDARTEQLLAINTVDTRVAELGLALDVVKTDVARLETASRRRISAAAETDTARRWSDFDAANDRCFSLRRRDRKTNLLSSSDFRWCEDRFLQGATIKSRYSNRSTEYSLDARFIDANDSIFPFHPHYPLLFTQSGLDSRSVLALPDPLDWQQNTAALLRLYQEHPVKPGEQAKRHETLQALVQASALIRDALQGLVVHSGGAGKRVFRQNLHEQAMQNYIQTLQKLSERVSKLDDPAAHPFGKRMTVNLDESLSAGGKRSVIEAKLSRSVLRKGGLQICPDAGSGEFQPQQDGIVAESRRFFGNPITAQELATAWNRNMVESLQLELDELAKLIPEAFVWASLDGMGDLQVCLTRLRPQYIAFTLEEGSADDTRLGAVTVAADIEVRFVPNESAAAKLGIGPGEKLLLSRRSAERSCTFGYSNDDEGCSRAQCLRDIAPTLWGADKNLAAEHVSCPQAPLRSQLMKAQPTSSDDVTAVIARLEPLYWERQRESLTRIEADALRSDEFEAASTQFLQYYALAGVTLGAYPESTKLLDGLFGQSSPLTPRNALHSFINARQPADVQLKALRGSADAVLAQVRKRGKEIQDPALLQRLPPLAALDDMTARIEVLDSIYSPD